jgi:import inner membrane translocase subunit TIM44
MSLANIREKSFSPTKRMYRIARTIPRPHFQQTRNVNVFSEFVNSVKRQVKENEQLQKDVKLLSQESQKVTESEAMKNAKKAISKTSEATSKVIGAVGSAVDATLETPLVKATGQVISKTTKVVADVTQKVMIAN